jgi:hypothetical protein
MNVVSTYSIIFLLCKAHLRSYLLTGIEVTFYILIIFVGIYGKCIISFFIALSHLSDTINLLKPNGYLMHQQF